jgi:hypothetical protein
VSAEKLYALKKQAALDRANLARLTRAQQKPQ